MTTEKRPAEKPEKPAEDPSKEAKTTQNEDDVFHPHRHGHISIGVPSTGVSHIDPGVVNF